MRHLALALLLTSCTIPVSDGEEGTHLYRAEPQWPADPAPRAQEREPAAAGAAGVADAGMAPSTDVPEPVVCCWLILDPQGGYGCSCWAEHCEAYPLANRLQPSWTVSPIARCDGLERYELCWSTPGGEDGSQPLCQCAPTETIPRDSYLRQQTVMTCP
jgi:hypothetical protein